MTIEMAVQIDLDDMIEAIESCDYAVISNDLTAPEVFGRLALPDAEIMDWVIDNTSEYAVFPLREVCPEWLLGQFASPGDGPGPWVEALSGFFGEAAVNEAVPVGSVKGIPTADLIAELGRRVETLEQLVQALSPEVAGGEGG